MAFLTAALLIVYIFFRAEFAKFFASLYKNHSYMTLFLLLAGMSFFKVNYQQNMMDFVQFIAFNLQRLQAGIANILSYILPSSLAPMILPLLVRALIFGFLIFFPEIYKKKRFSAFYASQVTTVNFIFKYALLIVVIIFAVFNF